MHILYKACTLIKVFLDQRSFVKVLVTGPTGLIGKALIHRLLKEGHEAVALARSPSQVSELDSKNIYQWDGTRPPPLEAFSGVEAVIHLAGEGIANKLWTTNQKKKLFDSRVLGTRNLVKAISQMPNKPQVLISASAIGFYGEDEQKEFDESSPKGQGFLADLCSAWEQESLAAKSLGVHVIIARLGLVLSKEGGFLSKMAPVTLGDGQQWMSWIHIEDLLSFFIKALNRTKSSEIYNLVSPEPLTNKDFTNVYSKKMGFPFVLSAPAFVLRGLMGEMSTLLLGSQKVRPQKLKEEGFSFQFPELPKALENLFGADTFLDNYHNVNQFIPIEKEKLFPFFSRAENLELITPPWLNFKITKKSADEISQGVNIEYKLKIHGVPVTWVTLISDWNPSSSFVDEQIKGPYSKWHHKHVFYPVQGGTLVRDEVTFRVPGWIFGKLFLTPWIRKDVNKIFSFRKMKLNEMCQTNKIKEYL